MKCLHVFVVNTHAFYVVLDAGAVFETAGYMGESAYIFYVIIFFFKSTLFSFNIKIT